MAAAAWSVVFYAVKQIATTKQVWDLVEKTFQKSIERRVKETRKKLRSVGFLLLLFVFAAVVEVATKCLSLVGVPPPVSVACVLVLTSVMHNFKSVIHEPCVALLAKLTSRLQATGASEMNLFFAFFTVLRHFLPLIFPLRMVVLVALQVWGFNLRNTLIASSTQSAGINVPAPVSAIVYASTPYAPAPSISSVWWVGSVVIACLLLVTSVHPFKSWLHTALRKVNFALPAELRPGIKTLEVSVQLLLRLVSCVMAIQVLGWGELRLCLFILVLFSAHRLLRDPNLWVEGCYFAHTVGLGAKFRDFLGEGSWTLDDITRTYEDMTNFYSHLPGHQWIRTSLKIRAFLIAAPVPLYLFSVWAWSQPSSGSVPLVFWVVSAIQVLVAVVDYRFSPHNVQEVSGSDILSFFTGLNAPRLSVEDGQNFLRCTMKKAVEVFKISWKQVLGRVARHNPDGDDDEEEMKGVEPGYEDNEADDLKWPGDDDVPILVDEAQDDERAGDDDIRIVMAGSANHGKSSLMAALIYQADSDYALNQQAALRSEIFIDTVLPAVAVYTPIGIRYEDRGILVMRSHPVDHRSYGFPHFGGGVAFGPVRRYHLAPPCVDPEKIAVGPRSGLTVYPNHKCLRMGGGDIGKEIKGMEPRQMYMVDTPGTGLKISHQGKDDVVVPYEQVRDFIKKHYSTADAFVFVTKDTADDAIKQYADLLDLIASSRSEQSPLYRGCWQRVLVAVSHIDSVELATGDVLSEVLSDPNHPRRHGIDKKLTQYAELMEQQILKKFPDAFDLQPPVTGATPLERLRGCVLFPVSTKAMAFRDVNTFGDELKYTYGVKDLLNVLKDATFLQEVQVLHDEQEQLRALFIGLQDTKQRLTTLRDESELKLRDSTWAYNIVDSAVFSTVFSGVAAGGSYAALSTAAASQAVAATTVAAVAATPLGWAIMGTAVVGGFVAGATTSYGSNRLRAFLGGESDQQQAIVNRTIEECKAHFDQLQADIREQMNAQVEDDAIAALGPSQTVAMLSEFLRQTENQLRDVATQMAVSRSTTADSERYLVEISDQEVEKRGYTQPCYVIPRAWKTSWDNFAQAATEERPAPPPPRDDWVTADGLQRPLDQLTYVRGSAWDLLFRHVYVFRPALRCDHSAVQAQRGVDVPCPLCTDR